jgi:NAD(P)-dependent dehydrogenase (short-subunit alcohol dehydrogenase family)
MATMKVLVVGASRGIGLEFVSQYRADGAEVFATARDQPGLARLRALGATALRLDVADAASAAGLAEKIDGVAFDIVILNAGIYGPRSQGLEAPTQADFDQVMHTNVLGAMRVLPQLAEALAPRARVVLLSSRMASMAGRSSASGWLYRASKAALNSVLKDTALVLAGRAVCVAVHPGWVRTEMGGDEADIDAAVSVQALCATIAALTPADHGGFRNFDGTNLPW